MQSNYRGQQPVPSVFAPSMPLKPYAADTYADGEEDAVAVEENAGASMMSGLFGAERAVLRELLPMNPSLWQEDGPLSAATHTQSGLPLKAPRPEPLAYLPEHSPTRRAFREQQLRQQQAQAALQGLPIPHMQPLAGRRPRRPATAPVPATAPGMPAEGGLFAEFLARADAIGRNEGTSPWTAEVVLHAATGSAVRIPSPAAATANARPLVGSAASAQAQQQQLAKQGLPIASPLGEIMALVRSRREARDRERGVQGRPRGRVQLRESPRGSPTSSERVLSPSRSRSRSRSRTRSPTRSPAGSPVRSRGRSRPHPSPKAEHHDAAFPPASRAVASKAAAARSSSSSSEAEINAALLQSFLQPLGLSFSSLSQLSAADIERIAEAVRSNSTEAIFPRASPIPDVTAAAQAAKPVDPETKNAAVEEAAKQNRHAHFLAHNRALENAAAQYKQQHPSLVALRAAKPFLAPTAPASGNMLLPVDPSATAAAAEAARVSQAAREAHGPLFAIRPVAPPAEPVPSIITEAPANARNIPVQKLMPPSVLEKLLFKLGGEEPPKTASSVSLSATTAAARQERAAQAAERLRADQHARDAAPRERILAAREAVGMLDQSVRQRNKAKLLARKANLNKDAPIPSAAANGASGASAAVAVAAAPSQAPVIRLSPKLFVQHLIAGLKPEHACSADGLFGRVLWKSAEEWQRVDAALDRSNNKDAAEADATVLSPSSAPLLSQSPFSFVVGGDALLKLLYGGLDRQSNWLFSLGFERAWVDRQLREGKQLRLVIFRGRDVSKDSSNKSAVSDKSRAPAAAAAAVEVHRATWDTVFCTMLPRILGHDASLSAATNEARRVVLVHLHALRPELSSTSWAAVHARARKQGQEHVYEGRSPLSVESAADLVRRSRFDVVQARRFLENHLHLTALFTGDGFATPEVDPRHSEQMADEAAAAAAASKTATSSLRSGGTKEFVMLTAPIASLPGVRTAPIHVQPSSSPSPSPSPTPSPRSRSRLEEGSQSARASSASPHRRSSSSPARFPRSRSRSVSRPRPPARSLVDSGLRLKPGTAEFEAFRARKEASIAEEAKQEEERIKREKETKQAERAAKQAIRTQQVRKLSRKNPQKHGQAAVDSAIIKPSDLSNIATTSPSVLTTVILPSVSAAPAASSAAANEGKDDYATDEFEADGESKQDGVGAAALASSDAAAPPVLASNAATGSATASGVMAAALAAAGLSSPPVEASLDASSNTKKKKQTRKRGSSKKKTTAKVAEPVSVELPRKPALPVRVVPAVAPSAPVKKSEPAAASSPEFGSGVASSVQSDAASASIPTATAAVFATAPPPLTEEQDRERKKLLLAKQLAERRAKAHAAEMAKTVAEQKRKENLRKLQQTCNEVVRPKSAAAIAGSAGGSSATVDAAASTGRARSSSRGRSRQKMSSPSGIHRSRSRSVRDQEREDQEAGIPTDAQLDAQLQRAFAQSDLLEADRARSKHAARAAQEAAANARRAQEEQEVQKILGLDLQALKSAVKRTPSPSVAAAGKKQSPPVVSSSSSAAAPLQRGTVSRALSPSDEQRRPAGAVSRVEDTASSPENAASAPVSAVPAAADPRLQEVYSKAQLLSSRFSSLIQRIGEQHAGAHGDESKESMMRQMVVAAALQQSPVRPSPQPSSSLPLDHEQQQHAALVQLQRTVEEQSVVERERRVHGEIVPPVHLQQPYERVQPESRLDASRRSSVVADDESDGAQAAVDAATPAWASSVLLPASLSRPPFPAGFDHAPLPYGQSVSEHAILFAEHTPNATDFLAAHPASYSSSAVLPRQRATSALPFYDLATREYEDLQQRVREQTARSRLLASGQL